MARTGSTRYDIQAEDNFTRVLDRAGRGFSNLQANVVTANAAFQLGATAVKAFSGALNLAYNEGAATVDRQAKVAAAIATTTEFLEAARFSAGLNGIAVEQVEKGYLKMTDAIGEAADGTVTYTRALDKLGLDAEVLKLKSTEDQYRAISDAFGQIGNQAERVQVSKTIFGRQGAFFIRNTADQIDAARAEMDAFGISTSRLDASKVEAANDAMFKIETIARGAKKEFASGLAPAIETAAEAILGMGRNTTDFQTSSQKAGATTIGWVGIAIDGFEFLQGTVASLGIGFLKVELASRKLQQATGEFLGGTGEFLGFDSEKTAFEIQVVESQLARLEKASIDVFASMDRLDARDNLLASFNQNIADAAAQAEKLDKALATSNSGGSFESDEEAGKERERVNARIQALSDQLVTEDEMVSRSLTRRLELIDDFERLNTYKKREADVLRSEAENEAVEKRRAIRLKEAEEIAKEQEAKAEKLSGFESQINQLKGGFEAEKAILIEQAEERQELIEEYASIAQLSKDEADALYLESERRRVRELTELRSEEAANARQIESDKQASVLGYLQKGLAAAAGQSRKAFAAQKVVDIGRAVIAGKVAAVESYKWGAAAAGPVGGAIAAGLSLAATGALIQSIGGSGGGGAGSTTDASVTESSSDAVANVANSGNNVTLIINQITDARFIDDTAFGDVVMNTIEEQVDSLGLTGTVDLNEVRLQVNREGRA